MKIAIINPKGHEARGVGFYTSRLVTVLKKQPDLEVSLVDIAHISSDTDLIHYPFFQPYFITLPFIKNKPIVVTIHDLTPVLFKNHFPPGIKGSIKWQIQKYLLNKNIDAVITDSLNSKNDIIKLTGYPKDKIFAIPLAADDIFSVVARNETTKQSRLELVKNKYHLPDKFILYVGDVNWNKNVIGIANACKSLNMPLVIVGKQAKEGNFDRSNIENQSLVDLLQKYGNDPQVQRLGFVSDEDLVAIYNLATLYVQPSFYEGFGLPILEAFACGCLVASSNKGSLPEICGNAAIMFDPNKTGDMEEKIQSALSLSEEKKIDYINKGLQISSNFSSPQTANGTIKVYHQALNFK